MIQRTKCRHYDVSNSRKPETRPNDHWQKKVVCSVCGIRVPGQKQLAQYMQSCTRHAKGCTYRFQDRYQWNIYMRRLQVSGDFKCDFPDCDIVYRDSGSLQHQVPSVHEGVRYKCDKCEDEFMSPKTLKVHEARDHDGQEPQYPCTESGCEKKYWTTTALGAHLITHTPSMHPVCPECGKSFYQEKGLKSHEVVHTNERPYKCHFCEADFKYTGNRLNDERSTHTQERPWVCWLCQFAFTRADQYTRHFSLHQLRDFNLSFPVEGCREMFVTPEALDAHLDSHAKEVQEMECVRPGRGWGRSLMEHKGQAHQEFPAPEHSSPDQKALEKFFHEHQIHCELQTTLSLLGLPVSLRPTKVRFCLDFVFTSREKLFNVECNEWQHNRTGYTVHDEFIRARLACMGCATTACQ